MKCISWVNRFRVSIARGRGYFESTSECFSCRFPLLSTEDVDLTNRAIQTIDQLGFWNDKYCVVKCPEWLHSQREIMRCRRPGASILTIKAVCGNGIIEEGEECDEISTVCNNCYSNEGIICFPWFTTSITSTSNCIGCLSPEAFSECKKLYDKARKSAEDSYFLKLCYSKCQFSISSYPITGLVRASKGKHVFRTREGVEYLCFLTILNMRERSDTSIKDLCDKCGYSTYTELNICKGNQNELGYTEYTLFGFQVIPYFAAGIVFILILLFLCGLIWMEPIDGNQEVFILIDFLQLFYLAGIEIPFSDPSNYFLTILRPSSFDLGLGWFDKLITSRFNIQPQLYGFEIQNEATTENIMNIKMAYFLESFMRYNIFGYFSHDCSAQIELYIYYAAINILLVILKYFYRLVNGAESKGSRLISNIKKHLFGVQGLMRIIHETYSFVLLYGMYSELYISFPLQLSFEVLPYDAFIIFQKLLARIFLVSIGLGYPIAAIYILILHPSPETVHKWFYFILGDCKKASASSRLIQALLIIRKFLYVIFILPTFAQGVMEVNLLILLIGVQITILTMLINGFPFKQKSKNIMAILGNVVFFFNLLLIFLTTVMTNLLDLQQYNNREFGRLGDIVEKSEFDLQNIYTFMIDAPVVGIAMSTIILYLVFGIGRIISNLPLSIQWYKEALSVVRFGSLDNEKRVEMEKRNVIDNVRNAFIDEFEN